MITTPKSEYEHLTHGSQKKLDAECDCCGKQYKVIYRNYLKSQIKRDNSGETFCSKCAVSKSNQNRKGNGKDYYISGDGYKMVRTGDKQNGIGWRAYSKEHKVVIEQYIGRKLKKGEVVHHIDGNKLNNNLSNLFLCSGHTEHRVAHTSLESVGIELYKIGAITFNTDTGQYELSKEWEWIRKIQSYDFQKLEKVLLEKGIIA